MRCKVCDKIKPDRLICEDCDVEISVEYGPEMSAIRFQALADDPLTVIATKPWRDGQKLMTISGRADLVDAVTDSL